MISKIFRNLNENRLFTYKVMHDGGSAPNPFNGVCTLAICKPAIRRTAKPGDVIVGFGCKSNDDDEKRIIYCMVVDESIPWEKYIQRCSSGDFNRIPKDSDDPGDCIWKIAGTNERNEPLTSWSGHDADDYHRDIVSGENVLVGKTYWYFGRSKLVRIPSKMQLPVLGRGHRSASNDEFRQEFENFFCAEVNKLPNSANHIYGEPWFPPMLSDPRKCGRSKIAQKESDLIGEEVDDTENP